MSTVVYYYITSEGENPVKIFLNSLSRKQQRKFVHILETIKQYGLLSVIPHLRKLTGTPLWEIRILGQDNLRILYAIHYKDSIVVLHGFIKKDQKTPQQEIFTALKRLQKWKILN